MKRRLSNVGVLLVALAISLLLAEGGARLVLNPADFLSVTTIRDDVLGIRVAAGAAGFDEWGFRNPRVPEAVDIVAIGDSHTYGNNATMSQSWPYVAGRLTGKSVYNLALGGYGPNQYFHLLKTRAVKLRPRWVVCGLYLGDDFENAFLMSYGKEYWSGLRSERRALVDADIWKDTDDSCALSPECSRSWHRQIRIWLSQHSLVYRLVVHGPALGRLKGTFQIRRAVDGRDERTASLIVAEAGIEEAFRPVGIRARLDQRSAAVREGMRITFELLGTMADTCRKNGCRLLVALIPTKETVFAEHIARRPDVHLRDVILDLVDQEAHAKARLVEFLDRSGIAYVDALPALRRRVTEQLYTRSDGDMHPNKNGYRVIGEVVGEFIRQDQRPATVTEHR
jgi:acetyltransferase AlgX (SGNH hydrolase-like protein)